MADDSRWPKESVPFTVKVTRMNGDRGAIRKVELLDRHGDPWATAADVVEAERLVEALNAHFGTGGSA